MSLNEKEIKQHSETRREMWGSSCAGTRGEVGLGSEKVRINQRLTSSCFQRETPLNGHCRKAARPSNFVELLAWS